ncbi:MAG: hypothetical protein MJ162_05235 [Treponema sp.]|nr:hypothetical protein [Treponema sp.]
MKIFSKNAKILFYFMSLFFLATGCRELVEDYKIDEIQTVLPEWDFPENMSTNPKISLPSLAFWKVEIYGTGIVSCSVENKILMPVQNKILFTTSTKNFSISTEVNQPFCVIATPVTVSADNELSVFFKPAGNCYPYEDKNNFLHLRWEQGFSAFVMKSLFCSGFEKNLTEVYVNDFISRFNWKKFCNLIEEKSADENYNPWFCDSVALLQKLSEGSFTATLLNHKNVKKGVVLAVDCFCDYVPWNLIKKESELIKTDKPNIYLYDNKQLLLVVYKSEKIILQDFINLPIYTEEI